MKLAPIAIGGDSMLFREGLQTLLAPTRFTVVSSAPSLDEVLSDIPGSRPELIIYAMGELDDASLQIQQLHARRVEWQGIRIVLLLSRLTADILRDAATARVHAVLSSEITSDILQRSLDLVMLDQQLFPALPQEPRAHVATVSPLSAAPHTTGDHTANPATANDAIFSAGSVCARYTRPMLLSDRERQILLRLADGASNKTIARDLTITEATVKVHIKGLLRKLQVKNRTQAAVWGLNNTALFAAGEHGPGLSVRDALN